MFRFAVNVMHHAYTEIKLNDVNSKYFCQDLLASRQMKLSQLCRFGARGMRSVLSFISTQMFPVTNMATSG